MCTKKRQKRTKNGTMDNLEDKLINNNTVEWTRFTNEV